MEETQQHTLSVENRKKITATAVESVDAFSPTQIVLSLKDGKIIVGGSEMKITAFSKATGAFAAAGVITFVKYAQKGAGLKQKLFK